MDIREFHKYNRLVRQKRAQPLTCSCNQATGVPNEYVLRATQDGEPVLYCAWCNSNTQPGLKMYDRIVATNKEFYV